MPLLVIAETVQGQAEARPVVQPRIVLVVYPSGDSYLIEQPLLQVRRGELAVVPELHRGQARIGAA